MSSGLGSVLLWGVVVLAAIAVLGLVAWRTRRWMKADDDAGETPVFTLQDLREMRDSGSLSEAEFQRMRAGMLASFGARQAGIGTEPGPDRAGDMR